MEIREYTLADVPALVRMRSDFTFEDSPGGEPNSRHEVECEAFLRQAIEGDRWRIWVAEDGGELIGHVFVGLVTEHLAPSRRRLAGLCDERVRQAEPTRPRSRGRNPRVGPGVGANG